MRTFAIVLLLAVVAYAKPTDRIVGGEDATPHEFPYQVSIQFRDPKTGLSKHFCGGTILNNSFVLTAAHCNVKAEELVHVRVVAGAHNFLNKTGFEQNSSVVKFVSHEKYGGGVGPYDVAVIELKTPFNFTDKIKAASLPKSGSNTTGIATLSGWGYTSDDYSDIRPAVLQKANLEIFDDATCHKLWKGPEYLDSNLCAGHLPGKPSACKGDSGGPLVQKEEDTTYVVGVVSWGAYPCGARKKPTVFVEVSHFVDWIKKQME